MFNEDEKKESLRLYGEVQRLLDERVKSNGGETPALIGKTPLAGQAALRGERGMIRLPIPDRYVNDPKNPWNPVVNITDEMAGAYVMDLNKHLEAIQSPQRFGDKYSRRNPLASDGSCPKHS